MADKTLNIGSSASTIDLNVYGRLYGYTGNGLEIQSTNTGSWKEGIRVYDNTSNGFSVMTLTNSDASDLLAMVHNGSSHAYYFDLKVDGTYYIINVPQKSGTFALLTDTVAGADNADKLDGYHFSDLESRYVNITGDTMTGRLYINAEATGANDHTGLLSITNNITAANSGSNIYFSSIAAMAPNMGSSQHLFLLGQARSSCNSGYIGFKYTGTSGSTSNYLTFGLYGVDQVLNITGNANVGIGTSSPSYKLDVAGTGRYTGNLLIQTDSQPPLTIQTSAGVWNYARLNNGSIYWDIATSTGNDSSSLQFRYNGGDSIRTRIQTTGRIDVQSTQTNNNLLKLWSSGQESSIAYADQSGTYTCWTVGRGTGATGSNFGWWNGSRNVMWLENTGILHIGTAVNYNELRIHGAFDASGTGIQDSNDRPSLKITGNYPQLVLMGGGASNGSHGATISLAAWDGASSTSGAFKSWTFGTPGYNATWMDLGYGTSTNPHGNGINGYQRSGETGLRIMRWNSSGIVNHYSTIIVDNTLNYGNYNEGIRLNKASNGWAVLTLGGALNSSSGTSTDTWLVGVNGNTLYFSNNGSSGATYKAQYEYNGHYRFYGTPGDGNPIIEANAQSSPATWNYGIAYRNPNMSTATHAYCPIGVSYSTCNMIGPEFYYAGSGSTSNYMGMEIYGKGSSMRWYGNLDCYAYGKLYGAVWNDYAEFRTASTTEPGRCVIENGDDTMSLSTERMQMGAEIISDTYGFAIGETDECKTPIAATGRVLAYPYESREAFRTHIGYPVCSGPNGTISIMTKEEAKENPWCIIGFVSAVPEYDKWGTGNVKVDGRIWIRIR